MLRVIDTKWKRGLHNLKALKLVLVVFNKKYKLTIKNTSDIKKFIDKLSLSEKASSELKTKLENYFKFNQEEYLKVLKIKDKLQK